MAIPIEIYEQMKCCLHNGDRIVEDPLLLPCGGNACSKCVTNFNESVDNIEIKCSKCKNTHKKEDIEKSYTNPVLKVLVEKTYLKDLIEMLKKNIETTGQEMKESTIYEEIIDKVAVIENEIDIRIESLIIELNKYRDELLVELFGIKEKLKLYFHSESFKSLQSKFYENLKKDDFEENFKTFAEKQNSLIECQKNLKAFKEKINEFNFEASDLVIPKTNIGFLKKPSFLQAYNKIKTVNKVKLCSNHLKDAVYLKSQNKIILTEGDSSIIYILDSTGNLIEIKEHEKFKKAYCMCVDGNDQLFILDLSLSKVLVLDPELNFKRDFSTKGLGKISNMSIDNTDNQGLLYITGISENKISIWDTKTGNYKNKIQIDHPNYVDFSETLIYVTSKTNFTKNLKSNKLETIKSGSNCIFILDKLTHNILQSIQPQNWLNPRGLYLDRGNNLFSTAYIIDENSIVSKNRSVFLMNMNGVVSNMIELSDLSGSNSLKFFDNRLIVCQDKCVILYEFEQ